MSEPPLEAELRSEARTIAVAGLVGLLLLLMGALQLAALESGQLGRMVAGLLALLYGGAGMGIQIGMARWPEGGARRLYIWLGAAGPLLLAALAALRFLDPEPPEQLQGWGWLWNAGLVAMLLINVGHAGAGGWRQRLLLHAGPGGPALRARVARLLKLGGTAAALTVWGIGLLAAMLRFQTWPAVLLALAVALLAGARMLASAWEQPPSRVPAFSPPSLLPPIEAPPAPPSEEPPARAAE